LGGVVGRLAYGRRVQVRESVEEAAMLRAVFVRTLKPGVTYQQFRDAWMPEQVYGRYPAKTSVGRNVGDDRQVITVLEMDVSAEEFTLVAPTLTRPDAVDRLAEIVESTQLEGVYDDVFAPDSF